MKKLFITILGLLVVLSCVQSPKSSQAETDEDLAEEQLGEDQPFETKKYSYSYDNDKIEISIDIDSPVSGNSLLVNAVREFISEELGGTYTDKINKGKKLVNYYGEEFLKELEGYKRENLEWGVAEEYLNGFYKKVKMTLKYETEKIITYIYEDEIYYNGAHGNENLFGVTFRKSDGRRFGQDMMRNLQSDGMHQLTKEGLKKYFTNFSQENVLTDSELKDYILTEDDVNYLPLPNHAPYVTKQGVEFTYQPYEISFYGAGMPSFVVSIGNLRPYLTATALDMLE